MCLHIGIHIGVNMQKEHFVCIILCDIFILTLLCYTLIFLQFVCIILFDIFILTLLCHKNIFLHFVCIILWETFILILLCHTYIFLHIVCIILCQIFILTPVCHTYILPGCCYQLSPLWNTIRSCFNTGCRLRIWELSPAMSPILT